MGGLKIFSITFMGGITSESYKDTLEPDMFFFNNVNARYQGRMPAMSKYCMDEMLKPEFSNFFDNESFV